MRNFINDLSIFLSAFAVVLSYGAWSNSKTIDNYEPQICNHNIYLVENTYFDSPSLEIEESNDVVDKFRYSKDDLEMLAILTMAEAESEPVEGQRLVISTVLNRVDSEHFPNTISEVIWQKNQFSPMWNGRFERCEVRPEIYDLVLSEVEARSDYDAIFFNANHYSSYGTPMYGVGNHYFSSYN